MMLKRKYLTHSEIEQLLAELHILIVIEDA